MNNTYIASPYECNRSTAFLVGGKAASLGEIVNAGARTPPYFTVTSEAYRRFIEHNDLVQKIRRLNFRSEEETVSRSREVRYSIENGVYPPDVEEQLREKFRELVRLWSPVAVRSSATFEDTKGASFAGQYESYLGIRNESDFLHYLRKCYASLYTDRAVAYRLKMNLPQDGVYMAAVVQALVMARSAGVMFTVNPLNGDPSMVVIESNWGLGESVVKGEVIPDRFSVNKITREFLETKNSNHKNVVYETLDDGSVTKRQVSNQGISLSKEEVLTLVEYGVKLEKYFGHPQDIEWSIDRRLKHPENVFLVQSRPVTIATTVEKKSTQSAISDPLDRVVSVLLSGVKV